MNVNFLRLFFLGGFVLASGSVQAQESSFSNLKVSGDLRYQYKSEHNFDLDTAGDSGNHSHALDGRVRATWSPLNDLTLMGEVRGYHNFSDVVSTEDEETGLTNSDSFVELRQLWARVDAPFGAQNWDVKLGRQRVSEPYNFWWNRDLDLARIGYNATLLNGFIAAGKETHSYRSGPQEFLQNEEDRARLMGEISHQWTYNHFIEGRFLHERDRSGLESIGSVVRTDDMDREDARLTWAGLRLRGKTQEFSTPFHYRVDAAGVTGSVDGITTTAGPGAGERTVTGHADTDVRGYAVDAEGVFETALPGRPSFLFGYAFGSGDDDTSDGKDSSFRQSGLQGGSSRAATMSHLRYHYGDTLSPDLSNLHILSAGVILPVFKASETSLTYRYYRLVEAGGDIRGDQIDAALDGVNSDLGHGLDLTVNLRVADELGLTGPLTGSTIRLTGGLFKAGDAYVDSAEGEMAMRAFAEFRLTF